MITGLILGLKPVPNISFQEYAPRCSGSAILLLIICAGSALIILYLLSTSWIVVIASLAACSRLSDDTKVLQLASVIQSYVILAFAFTVLATAHRFGTNPECNHNTFAVIFRPFSALKAGRILGWIIFSLVFTGYTAMTARDYTTLVLNRIRKNKELLGRTKAPIPQQQQPPVAAFTPHKANQTQTPQRQVKLLFLHVISLDLSVYVSQHSMDNPPGTLTPNCYSHLLSFLLPGFSSCSTRNYSFIGIDHQGRMENLPGSSVRCGQNSFNLQDWFDNLFRFCHYF